MRVGLWIWRGVLTVVMFAAGVGPEQARSNIGSWLNAIGLPRASGFVSSLGVDHALIWACALLLALSFAPQILVALNGGRPVIPERAKAPDPFDAMHNLAGRAVTIITRIRNHRNTNYLWREDLEPPEDIYKSALSVLIDFEKAGFPLPNLGQTSVLKNLVALDEYFSTVLPFLRAKQYKEALEVSKQAVRLADEAETKFDESFWFQRTI